MQQTRSLLPTVHVLIDASGIVTSAGFAVLPNMTWSWLNIGANTCNVWYAQWDSNVIALTWNTNGGTPSTVTTPSSCIIGSLESEPGSISGIAQPTRTGYRFLGWGIQ